MRGGAGKKKGRKGGKEGGETDSAEMVPLTIHLKDLCSLTTGAMFYLELFNGEFKFIVTPPLVPFSGENSL